MAHAARLTRRIAAVLVATLVPVAGFAAPAQKSLDCGQLVPTALVARLFPGGTVKPFQADQRTALCNISLAGNDYAVQATYLCRPTDTFAAYEAEAAKKKKPNVPGIGRGAVGDERLVYFYDDDTQCIVEASDNTAGKKAVAFARELALVLKPGLIPAMDAGSLALSCAKLLPDALVKKWAPGATVKARFVQTNQMECTLERAAGPVTINYTCRGAVAANYWTDYKQQMVKAKATDVSDVAIGKGGAYSAVHGIPSVGFTDGDTGCLVLIMAMGFEKPNAVGLATDVEKALTADSAR